MGLYVINSIVTIVSLFISLVTKFHDPLVKVPYSRAVDVEPSNALAPKR